VSSVLKKSFRLTEEERIVDGVAQENAIDWSANRVNGMHIQHLIIEPI
jgi:hypothetical protein